MIHTKQHTHTQSTKTTIKTLRNRDRTDPNYHGKVNRMRYLFLVQANGGAFSEIVFKPVDNPPFWRHLGVGTIARILCISIY